jgi:hypothetical protein
MQEIPLLDYDGDIDKDVDYRIKDNNSGVDIKRFKLTAEDMLQITGNDIRDNTIVLSIERTIQYKPWNFGKYTPGAGQIGIYELKADNGDTYFAVIKDYRAFEGDWRIMLVIFTKTENDLKYELQVDPLGFTFMDYILPMK